MHNHLNTHTSFPRANSYTFVVDVVSPPNPHHNNSVTAPVEGGVVHEGVVMAPSPSQSTRSNDVPLLIQDPFNVLLSHFLLLPFNVDTAYFLTIVKACYNLTLTQARFHFLLSASSKKCSDLFYRL